MSFWEWLFGPPPPTIVGNGYRPASPPGQPSGPPPNRGSVVQPPAVRATIPPPASDMLGAATLAAVAHDAVVIRADPAARFARCVAIVLKHEGGFVDHPSDPGGATNRGISLRYARSQGSMFDLDGDGDVDRADILLVNPTFAASVYREWFWRDVRGDNLPAGVDLAAFDFAVNSGPVRAIKAMQRAIGTDADGFIGDKTRAAIARAEPRKVVGLICDDRMAFLRGLNTWPTFGKGWTSRVQDVRAKALEMAS